MNISKKSLLVSATLFALLSSGAMAQGGGGAMGTANNRSVRGYTQVGVPRNQQRNAVLYGPNGQPVPNVQNQRANGYVVPPVDARYNNGVYNQANRQTYIDGNGNVAEYIPQPTLPGFPGYTGANGQTPIYDAYGNIIGYSSNGPNAGYDANGNPIYYPGDQTRYRNVGPFRIRY